MNKLINLNPFQNVQASGLAYCDLSNLADSTIETLNLTLGGTTFTKAMITGIFLRVNSKVVFETTGANLDLLEAFKGYTGDATHLSINLMEVKARTLNAFRSGSIMWDGQAGIKSMRLEVQIAGATAPTLSGVAEVSPAVINVGEEKLARYLSRHHKATQTIGAGGVKTGLLVPHIDPFAGGSSFKRIAIFSANLTALQVVRSGVTEVDLSVADINFMQKKAGRVPQAGMTVLDFILDNTILGNVWQTTPDVCNTAQVYGVFSAGENISIETEELLQLASY